MLEAKNIIKKFGEQTILKGIDLKIDKAEMVSIVGRSGSGKSTLLYIISGLDKSTSGEVFYDHVLLNSLPTEALHDHRRRNIGFVFQFHYLLPEFSVLENVLMPTLKETKNPEYKKFAIELLNEVGLGDKINKLATELSGGEQQRVAIARALVMKPHFLFADEPTGNLDTFNGELVMKLFQKFNQELKTTIIYVTHDTDYANMAKRKITLVDGSIGEDRLH